VARARGLALMIAAALALAASTGGAHAAYTYKRARLLYDDCAAPAKLASGAPTTRRERCAAYLNHALSAWNLAQDPGTCSRAVGAQLPDAYVRYWHGRGLGLLGGEFRSAEASVNDFLDSQKRPCPPQRQ
jgi:hypothetical protein